MAILLFLAVPLHPFQVTIKFNLRFNVIGLLSWGSRHGAGETNLSRNHEVAGLIPGLSGLGSGTAMSYGVGGRHGLDLVLPRLWGRPAAAALTQTLAWELPDTAGAALN